MFRQHLIDPEICIRCNTCESICTRKAISHDSRNYVVDADLCNLCMDCISPCPTGAIDSWRELPRALAYPPGIQLGWDELPAVQAPEHWASSESSAEGAVAAKQDIAPSVDLLSADQSAAGFRPAEFNAVRPPWSAAHPYVRLYGPGSDQAEVLATVAGNVRVTAVGSEYDTHHIVLDFGSALFKVLEGQSIGVIAPGVDGHGRPHHPRQYSVASPRNGERPGYNNVAITVKRVLQNHQGEAVRGVASNYLCDLSVGDTVRVVGPFGTSFLMPNHAKSSLVMICTGTGSAPMRAMTEWRRRQRTLGDTTGGRLLLFFGARTPEELPYFGPLQKLPKDFIDIHFAFSRQANKPRRYVQDAMRDCSAELAALLTDDNAYFYVCGLRAMEDGVLLALRDAAEQAGLDWQPLAQRLRDHARLHLETY